MMSDFFQYISDLSSYLHEADFFALSATSYLLILVAEIGDKSQLVCMMLAARYRATPVILGSILAFLLLNTLAVVFGVAMTELLPQKFIFTMVAILFAAFAIHAFRAKHEQDDEKVTLVSNKYLLLSTFLLITVAEIGDKTQIAVVGLSSSSNPVAIWIGATLALFTTSAIGVWAGRTILQKMPMTILHKISGSLFLMLAIFAGYKAMT